jgi:hypothetical protein
MTFRTFLLCLGATLLVAGAVPAHGAERESNAWPSRVTQLDSEGQPMAWQGAGPLFFSRPLAGGGRVHGFRPFWVARENAEGRRTSSSFLYPVFFARSDDTVRAWSVLNLINHRAPAAGAATENAPGGFDVWPFYFSRDTGTAATSYRAFFPVAGEVKNRFYRERVSWLLFPLYLRTEARGVVAKSYLWPFVRTASGGGVERFALWPLLGWRNQEGVSRQSYYLWPLIYRKTTGLDTPTPLEAGGVLPFHAYERSAELQSETWLWPFFGYLDRAAPYRYSEVRYFWPLFVQGAGDDRMRSRWAPFYTRSVIQGYDKQWVLWPLYRRDRWEEDGLARSQARVLFFLYRSETQRRAAPADGPVAIKDHLWPLYSRWDNGAGRRQFQLLSPFGSFFPDNEDVKETWGPLLALYRRDVSGPDEQRESYLFDLITRRRSGEEREFHLGPLYGSVHSPAGDQIRIARGLLTFERPARGPWRATWFDSGAKHRPAPAAR